MRSSSRRKIAGAYSWPPLAHSDRALPVRCDIGLGFLQPAAQRFASPGYSPKPARSIFAIVGRRRIPASQCPTRPYWLSPFPLLQLATYRSRVLGADRIWESSCSRSTAWPESKREKCVCSCDWLLVAAIAFDARL